MNIWFVDESWGKNLTVEKWGARVNFSLDIIYTDSCSAIGWWCSSFVESSGFGFFSCDWCDWKITDFSGVIILGRQNRARKNLSQAVFCILTSLFWPCSYTCPLMWLETLFICIPRSEGFPSHKGLPGYIRFVWIFTGFPELSEVRVMVMMDLLGNYAAVDSFQRFFLSLAPCWVIVDYG